MNWARCLELAQAEVAGVLAGLPEELRVRAAALPVAYEPVPNSALIRDGVESDTLGLFVGGDYLHEDDVPMPSQILLFLDNIRDSVDDEDEAFREEVRITFLHELGHYLGLDEDDLDERGLL